MIDRGVGMGGGGLQNLGGEGAGLEGTWASVSTVMQSPTPGSPEYGRLYALEKT